MLPPTSPPGSPPALDDVVDLLPPLPVLSPLLDKVPRSRRHARRYRPVLYRGCPASLRAFPHASGNTRSSLPAGDTFRRHTSLLYSMAWAMSVGMTSHVDSAGHPPAGPGVFSVFTGSYARARAVIPPVDGFFRRPAFGLLSCRTVCPSSWRGPPWARFLRLRCRPWPSA